MGQTGCRPVARFFEYFPRNFHENTLLRVHNLGQFWIQPEKFGIKLVCSIHNAPRFHVERIGR